MIVDAQDSDANQQQKLARIIETLEMENIGVILITDRVKVPVKSFSLAPVKSSFTMSGTTEAVSVDELWTRVSVNLAYRKKSEGMAVKPAIPPKQIQTIYKNKLAEQLSMTGALVDNLDRAASAGRACAAGFSAHAAAQYRQNKMGDGVFARRVGFGRYLQCRQD